MALHESELFVQIYCWLYLLRNWFNFFTNGWWARFSFYLLNKPLISISEFSLKIHFLLLTEVGSNTSMVLILSRGLEWRLANLDLPFDFSFLYEGWWLIDLILWLDRWLLVLWESGTLSSPLLFLESISSRVLGVKYDELSDE